MRTDRAKVSIVPAQEYDSKKLHSAIRTSLALIGGIDSMVRPGCRVFVKINHLSPPSEADKGIVTHPVFVEAVLEILKEAGAEITVGDDIQSVPEDGFRISGFRQMCERVGVKLINLRDAGHVETGCAGHFLDKVYVSSPVLEADVIVNLPKLKTHSLTVLTGGVKNMYGVIPQGLRTKYHSEYAGNANFSRMLTDILSVVKPRLTIMDAVIAMEGNGPANGKLRKAGLILAGNDTVALDAIAAGMVGAQPADVLTTRFSHEQGLGVGNLDQIDVVGQTLNEVTITDFSLPRSTGGMAATLAGRLPGPLRAFLQEQLVAKPRLHVTRCTQCRACEKACPVSAIEVGDSGSTINLSLCIGCLCCNEVCRFGAITPTLPITGRGFYFLLNTLRKARAGLV